MRRLLPAATFVSALALVLAGATAQEKKGSSYRDALYGFSFEPPVYDGKVSDEAPATMVLSVSGPATGGFATNMSVVAQRWTKSLKDWRALTEGQFEASGHKILSWKTATIGGKESLVFEYESAAQGRLFHCIAAAVPSEKDTVLLFTGTTTADGWVKYEKLFQAALESVKLGG